jgi:hypothetical protein
MQSLRGANPKILPICIICADTILRFSEIDDTRVETQPSDKPKPDLLGPLVLGVAISSPVAFEYFRTKPLTTDN